MDSLDFSHVIDPDDPGSLAASSFRETVEVEVTSAVPSVDVPAVLGSPIIGTDRLAYVPRVRISQPVVYVCRDPMTSQILYVGLTSDLDARRIRHEAEIDRGDPSRSGGSNMVPSAWGVMRADWLAVPVPMEHGRHLEQALIAILKPVLQKARKSKLNALHEAAMVAAGWTEAAAARVVELSRASAL
ncbi:MAG: hypothetical protein Rubg2KO_15140 [Rubricoccaceae bacterium]